MKKMFYKITAIIIAVILLLPICLEVFGEENDSPMQNNTLGVEEGALNLNCKSAILMEATTGTVLYAQNAEEALPPASVTKVMTLLLVMEAIDAGTIRIDDTVSVSAKAASMGGSQVFLEEGEQMSVEDLLKSVVIASANDAAVALAEYVSGSVDAFVAKMNAKAAELGMLATHFENVTGLDDTAENHLTSAKDIALMSTELIKHPLILQYSSIWMDTIRDGAFGLTNTNRLVRFYKGCTGLKTGSTSKAGFCVSATAERDGMSLVCVIMGAESRDIRNAAATTLLDWGFANFALFSEDAGTSDPISVKGSSVKEITGKYPAFSCVVRGEELSKIEKRVTLIEEVVAPISAGEKIGTVSYIYGDKEIGSVEVCSETDIKRISFFEILTYIFAKSLLI
ncbi:MAG: D-alanyl-D-alanine carboxypeptidase [Clostridia bacterium]|nr:D-alanyl-D-alanine carboxypeptidase [Clostridia bacterium]